MSLGGLGSYTEVCVQRVQQLFYVLLRIAACLLQMGTVRHLSQ